MAIVKSYIANTQKEAFDKVKADLGAEAVIINTRFIRRKGFMGFFQKPLVELTAVVDDLYQQQAVHVGKDTVQKDREEIQTLIKESMKNEKLERIEKQMVQVSDMVSRVYKDVDFMKNKEISQYSPELQEVFNKLVYNDTMQDNALRIIKEIKEIMDKEKVNLDVAISVVLNNYIFEPSPIKLNGKKKKVIIFVGPTGVGKTTTLAKIAAIFSLQENAKVGLITEDTYRIGAVEQLKIYADILGLELGVLYEPEEIKQIIDKMDDVELILIDTAGKSPKDELYHDNIKKLIEISGSDEVHLVISATTGYSTAVQILESYSFLPKYKLLFTKLDEYGKWGIILNIKMLTEMPLSYITNGQNVAEDILVANSDTIASKLLGSEEIVC